MWSIKRLLSSKKFSTWQPGEWHQPGAVNSSALNYLNDVVRNTAEDVLMPLKDGICSLNMVYKQLIDADVDPLSGKCSNYSTIRQQIEIAEQSLKRSEQEASSGLRHLDGSLERLTQDEGKLEQEKCSTELTLNNLITTQRSNEKLLNNSEGALGHAQENLRSAKLTLEAQEQRRNTAEIVWGVGIGVTLIPIVGWVVGPAMIIGGAIEMDQASKAVRDAECEVSSSRDQVDTYKSKVSEYENKISNTKSNINQKNTQLDRIRRNIQDVRSKRENLAEFQQKVRHALTTLGVITGRVRVLECHTRKFIAQQPLMTVMEEVMKAAEQISGDQLLYNNGMSSLIDQMKANHQKLAAICAADTSVEYANYY